MYWKGKLWFQGLYSQSIFINVSNRTEFIDIVWTEADHVAQIHDNWSYVLDLYNTVITVCLLKNWHILQKLTCEDMCGFVLCRIKWQKNAPSMTSKYFDESVTNQHIFTEILQNHIGKVRADIAIV